MNVGIVLNPSKLEVYSQVEEAIEWLEARGCEVYLEEESPLEESDDLSRLSLERMGEACEVVVVFGGDGSILRIADPLSKTETPILGINSGQLGFLTETPLEDLEAALERLLDNDLKVTKRSMLSGQKPEVNEELLALNELVLSRERHGRVVEIAAYVDGDSVTNFVCDGIIISSPTGSTAYNLAANGPIVHPELDSLILNPICPHTLSNRPLILPPGCQIRLEVLSDDRCNLIADGQRKIRNLGKGGEVEIYRAERNISLIVPPGLSFYDLLGSKLNWSGKT